MRWPSRTAIRWPASSGPMRPHQNHCRSAQPMSLMGPGRVKTRSVLFVGGVSGDPGGIVRLGAANSAELVRADAYWLIEAKNAGLLRPVRPVSCVDCLHQSANA